MVMPKLSLPSLPTSRLASLVLATKVSLALLPITRSKPLMPLVPVEVPEARSTLTPLP